MAQDPSKKPSWLQISDEEFLTRLKTSAKHKERSHQTHRNIHLPELNARLNLSLDLPDPSPPPHDGPYALHPDLTNTSKIEVVYFGNSMLERFKTSGRDTELGKLGREGKAWNAGCGGDKNENVLYRLSQDQGLYPLLKKAGEENPSKCAIKLWVLASGTNNLHPKRGLRAPDIESWRLLVEACLRIAPESRVLACDGFYRKDISDELVDVGNQALKGVVEEMNREMIDSGWEERVMWLEAREAIGKDMLVDHVHLMEKGYRVWDDRLWPSVQEFLLDTNSEADGLKGNSTEL